VSKNHAEIYFANDVWVLRDLDSANGTYVNRRKARGLVELEAGDLVQMGRVLFKIVRCDMIGMDTQTIQPGQAQDDVSDELLDDVAVGDVPSQADDDSDLEQLLSDSDQDSQRDDLIDLEVAEPAPAAVQEKPQAAGPVEPIELDDPEDVAPETKSVQPEVADDDDDSFFADAGQLTDTADGQHAGDDDASQDDSDQQDIESIDLDAPLKLAASDSSAAEIEVPAALDDEEEDPFLPSGAEAESDDDSDLISLEDESGMGPRSHGTTLLTAAHDDGTPVDDAEESDAVSMDADDDEDEDDAEPPTLVGLALEHAAPQQPKQKAQEPEPQVEEPQAQELEAVEPQAQEPEPHAPTPEPAAESPDPVAETKVPEPEATEPPAPQEQAEEVTAAVDAEQTEDEVADVPVDEPADSEPEEALAAAPDIDSPDLDSPDLDAPDLDVLPLDELPELGEEDEPVVAAAVEDGPGLDEPDEGQDFDIDAAFDQLSAGLDDSLSGAPAIDADEPQQAPSPAEASAEPAPVEQEPVETPKKQAPAKRPEAAGAEDPLVGSQLDVGFIKDALSRLEANTEEAGPVADESDGQKAAAPVAEPAQAPAHEPTPAAAPAVQSPPPGLTATGMNPTSVSPPAEPRRSYVAKGKKGLGRWFFALLLLASLGVAGWLISENYEKLIGNRTTPGVTPGASDLPDLPTNPSDPLADRGEQDKPEIDTPPPPTDIDLPAEEDTSASDRPGPDPFSAGPTVIGSDALDGLTRGSDDNRPLDPPRETTPKNSVTGSDPIRQPDQPTINNPNPGLDKPSNDDGPVVQVPKDPPVAQSKPERIVFLVDASGSLVDSLPQMLAWLNRALQTVDANEQFAIYFFKSDKPIAIKPKGMLKPSRNLLTQIEEEWLNASRLPVFPSGRSNPAKAITQALTLEPTDIYLLSDDSFGFYQGDTTSSDALDLVKQAIGEADVRVHGVQFFYRSDQSILETVANQYDGTFEFVRESVVPDEDPIDLLEELGNE
jgi:hypothetical protein